MSEVLRRKIYNRILRGLAERFEESDERTLCSRLRPYYDTLWNSYRGTSVHVDYTAHEIVGAYMLAYFPIYTFMAERSLLQLVHDLPDNLRVVVACGGPAPELVGLAMALQGAGRRARVDAVILDKYSDGWEYGGHLSAAIAGEFFPGVTINLKYVSVELAHTALPDSRPTDLLIMQNCMNEVNTPAQLAGVNVLLQSLGRGAYSVFCDQHNYRATHDGFDKIRSLVRDVNAEVVDEGTPWQLRPNIFVPDVVHEYFSYGRPRIGEDGRWQNGRSIRREIMGKSLVVRARKE